MRVEVLITDGTLAELLSGGGEVQDVMQWQKYYGKWYSNVKEYGTMGGKWSLLILL